MSDRFTNIESSLMGINGFRPESHVAQQSRRDKLRVPQTSTTSHHHIQDFSSTHSVNLPIRSYSGLSNPDLFQLRSFRNYDLLGDPTMFSSSSSDVHNNNNNLLFAQKECLVMNQESNRCEDESGRANLGSDPSDDTSFASSSHVVPSNFMVSSKVIHSQQSPCHWKEVGVGAQQNCEWISKFVNGSSSSGGGGGGGEGGGCSNSNEACPLLVGENLPPPRYKEVDCSVSVVAHNEGYQDHVQSSFVNNHHQQGSDISDQKSFGEINYSTTPQMTNYQSNNMQQVRETSHGSWVDNGGNELVLLPTYGNHQTDDVESHQWSRRNFEGIVGDSTTQSLSLSLSSHHPHSELLAPHYGIRFASGNVQSRVGVSSGSQDMRSSKFGYYFQDHQASCSNREVGNTVDSFGGCSSYARLCTGPLGPFTGYATILKNSKFLRPSQQLLDEFCRVTAPKVVTSTSEMSERGFRDVAVSSDLMNVENECGRKDVNSGISSSTRSPKSYDEGKAGSGHCQSNLPEFQQKKSKLVCMQEEVCRKYKQYQQQMQMVISSFESVAGLDAATPYTSLALKTVSKHFRCLKNTIADHLRYIRKALGEDFSSLTSRTSSSKDDATIPRLSFNDHNLGKQTATGNSLGFLDSQQHVWRPQRGLPERSVAVLRAWLFEHFLHPYPTDTDKHMLATQAGLTRNQVSNWFINARVRVWKPMVEEMHLLETKASSETGMAKPNRRDSSGERVGEECSNKLMIDPVSSEGRESPTTMNAEVGESSRQQWHHDKRSRMECQIPTGLDGNLMGFIPYHQSALEIGGLGAVSLTLGLRHSSENAQQQQQQQQHEHQLGGHFGGQMFHDFVG